MLVGYFSLFDLGLGRALTKLVAEKLASKAFDEIPALIWTAITVMLLLGVLCAASLCLSTSFLVHHILKVPVELQRETSLAFYPLALSIPLVTVTSGLRGILEAHHKFALLNTVRLGMGLYTFLGPLLVLLFSTSLVWMIVALLVGRACSSAIHLKLCVSTMPNLMARPNWSRLGLRSLLAFGGWITVSNVIGPVMVYLDRFMIGAFISVTAVAYYAAPFEMVTKVWLIPGALATVLFPAFSATATSNSKRMVVLYDRAIKAIFLLLFPVILGVVVYAHEILRLWLGPAFAQHSTIILQWLSMGVFINSLGYIPYALVQAAGRPDLTGKLHLTELPCYLAALWWVMHRHSLPGTACIWSMRLVVDSGILFLLSRRFVRESEWRSWRIPLFVGTSFFTLWIGTFPDGPFFKTTFFLLAMTIFFSTAWLLAFSSEDRSLVQAVLRVPQSDS